MTYRVLSITNTTLYGDVLTQIDAKLFMTGVVTPVGAVAASCVGQLYYDSVVGNYYKCILTNGTIVGTTWELLLTSDIPVASESEAGIIMIADNADVLAGVNDTKVMTPLKTRTYYFAKVDNLEGIDAVTGRSNLGLGTISTQNRNSVVITGGTVDGAAIGTAARAQALFIDAAAAGNFYVGDSSGTGGTQHGFVFRTGANARWSFVEDVDPGVGIDSGADLLLSRYSDAGIRTIVLSLSRTTMDWNLGGRDFFFVGRNVLFNLSGTMTIAGAFAFGTSGRILGDFNNIILSNRTLFKSSAINGITSIGAIPNGIGSYSDFTAYSRSNPISGTPFLLMGATNALNTRIHSGTVDTAGTPLPLLFFMGPTEAGRIESDGSWALGQGSFKALPAPGGAFNWVTVVGGNAAVPYVQLYAAGGFPDVQLRLSGKGAAGVRITNYATADGGVGSFTSEVGMHYFLRTVNQVIYLPAGPQPGQIVSFASRIDFDANPNITMNRNGSLIEGEAADIIIDTIRFGFDMLYVDNTAGWRML